MEAFPTGANSVADIQYTGGPMQFRLMDAKLIAGVAVILLIVVVGIALYVRRQRTITSRQRGRFGSEYDRAALGQGSKHKAEAKLVDRETRVEN